MSGPTADRMKCVGLDSEIQDKKMYEPFDILEIHGFIRLDDLDKIADLPERKAEKLYIDIYSSVFGSQTMKAYHWQSPHQLDTFSFPALL